MKTAINIVRVATFLFCILLVGCSIPAGIQKHAIKMHAIKMEHKPITVEGSKPVAFYRAIFSIPQGKSIGGHYQGWTRAKSQEYYWQSGFLAVSDEYKFAASEELRNMGYSVLGAENLLFGDDESAKARYQLGGTIQDIKYNTYAPSVGDFSEASIQVKWQLLDTLRKEIIFTATTEGYGKQTGMASDIILLAFRKAIHNLMADNSFIKMMEKTDEEDIAKPLFNKELTITQNNRNKALKLPNDIDDIMYGVVVIRVGNTHASGFIVSRDGYILTAAHVVTGVDSVSVKMRSGLELDAKVIRIDKAQDIALLKVHGRGHKALQIEVNGLPPLGQELFAIGAPTSEKLSFSVSKGIVSGHRENKNFKYIQTDASLNPGNSGGPLLNKDGQVVGIVSWKLVAPGLEGLSFGVPLEVVSSRLGIKWSNDSKE